MILSINNRHKWKHYNRIYRKIISRPFITDVLLHFFRKSKLLADQYQLLVDQRQEDIERLRRTLQEKSAVVERVERTNQDEVGDYLVMDRLNGNV